MKRNRSSVQMRTTSRLATGFLTGALIASTVWSSSWVHAQRVSVAPGQAQATPVVTVARVIAQSLDRPVGLPGDLVAFQDVELRARVAGFVDSIAVDRGSMVKKGSVLAEIVAPELKAQRSEADAKVQSAQSQRVEAEAKLAADGATYQRLKTASATPGVVAGNDDDLAAKRVGAEQARVENWKLNEQATVNDAALLPDLD